MIRRNSHDAVTLRRVCMLASSLACVQTIPDNCSANSLYDHVAYTDSKGKKQK